MSSLFKDLTPEEQKEYRQWARDNYEPGMEVNPVWHPIVRDEIELIKKEQGSKDKAYGWIESLADSTIRTSAVMASRGMGSKAEQRLQAMIDLLELQAGRLKQQQAKLQARKSQAVAA